MLLTPLSRLEKLLTGSGFEGMVVESSKAMFGVSMTDTHGPSLDADSNNGEEILAPHERRMISSILKLDETTVHEVMVPRADIVAVDNSTSLVKVAEFMSETGHSRIPIYDHNLDNIVGVVHSKDLLKYLSDSSTKVEITDIARPPLFIPDAKRLDELLRDFQEMHIHMAVVVDEYGGTSGLVTIEDLLEEIVGEIEDEFDIPENMVDMIEDDEFLMDARVSLEELNRVFDLELEGEGFDTLGGLLYQQMGKIPAPDDEITVGQLNIKVISTLGRRIKKVQVRRLAAG
jgi:CBS domain containing-hemolysin-like protein